MMTIWGKQVFATLTEIVDPHHTALLLVDIQNDFCHEDGYYGTTGRDLSAIRDTLSRTGALLASAREAGVLPVWIQQTHVPDALADSPAWLRRRTRGTAAPEWTIDGTWGQSIVDELVPRSNEPVVIKHRSSAFIGTPLDLILRSQRIQTAVVAGVVTQGCVESTARDATFYDYYVVLAQDCVATTNAELHAASLRCQETRYDFAQSDEVIAAWTSGSQAAAS